MKKTSCTQGSLLDMPTPEKKISAKPLPDMQKRMSRLERLIEELCPNGVEYKTLGSICTLITKGTTPKKYTVQGINFIKTESIENSCINKEKLCFIDDQTFSIELKRSILKENDILFAIAGSIGKCAIVASDILPANTNQALAIIRLKNYINNKYIFYVLNSNIMKKYIEYNVKGSAQSNLNLHQMNQFLLPVPPLPVQEEIVRILDTFSELTSELTSKLEFDIVKIHNQYNIYLNNIFLSCKNILWKKMEEEFPFIRNGFVGTVTPFFSDKEHGIRYIEGTNIHNGKIYDNNKVYVTKDFHNKYKKNELKSDDILMVQSGHVGESAVVGEKYKGSNCHALIIMSNAGRCNSKFINYYFQTTEGKKKLKKITTGGTIKHILASAMRKFPIPVPPIEEQERIVSILDRFEALSNDLTGTLSTEIEARKKQYEYYRDKLLTFREAK